MKNILITIFILLSFLQGSVNAQIFNREINKGFFFYEGKYIEPPYKITTKDSGSYTMVYINEYMVFKTSMRDRRKHYVEMETFYGYPPGLTKNSPLKDFHGVVIPKFANEELPINRYTYIGAACNYYYVTYPFKQACDSIMNYMRSAPNIKSYDGFRLETYSGDTMYIETASSFMSGIYEHAKFSKTLKGRIKLNPKRKKNKRIRKGIREIRSILRKNDVIFNSSFQQKEKNFTVKLFSLLLKIDTLSTKQREDYLKEITNRDAFYASYKAYLLKFKITPGLKERMKKRLEKHIKKQSKNSNQPQSQILNENYTPSRSKNSPSNSTIKAWVPYQYEIQSGYPIGAFRDAFILLSDIFDYAKKQDYPDSVIYKSSVAYGTDMENGNYSSAHLLGSCTLENFKNMAGAGIISIHAHGLDSIHDPTKYGVLLSLFKSQADAEAWCQGEDYLYPFETRKEWTDGKAWGVRASKDFALQHFKPQNDANSTITFLNSCVGYTNLWGKSMGGVCFSYENPSYEDDMRNNNKYILKRMNGTTPVFGDTKYRTASQAYNNALSEGWLSQSMTPTSHPRSIIKIYPENSDITLCPSMISCEQGAVYDEVGINEIVFDTWCDTRIPAQEVADVEHIQGYANIVFSWDNPQNNKSKKIKYQWTAAGNFKSKITLKADKIRNWTASGPGSHRVDFNRRTPITDTYSFYLQRGNYAPEVDFYAENTQVLVGNEVHFVNESNVEGAISYEWDFGDGHFSNDINPVHTYSELGQYDVILSVTNNVDTYTKTRISYINVFEESTGDLECNYAFAELNTQTEFYADFLGYDSFDYVYTFTFSFGDGSPNVIINNMGAHPIAYHQYTEPGYYEPSVSLEITPYGNTENVVFSGLCSCGAINIENPNPCAEVSFASVGLNLKPEIEEEVDFKVNGGTPPYSWMIYIGCENDNESYCPDYNANIAPNAVSNELTLPVQFPAAGQYYVSADVVDANGCRVVFQDYFNVIEPSSCVVASINTGGDYQRIPLKKNGHYCGLNTYLHHYSYWTRDCRNMYCSPNYGGSTEFRNNGDTYEQNSWEDYYYSASDFESYIPAFQEQGVYDLSASVSFGSDPYNNVNTNSYDCEGYATEKIEVVDCERVSSYVQSSLLPFFWFYSNALYSERDQLYSSGWFRLDSTVNNYIYYNDLHLNACNSITLNDGFETGNGLFIAETNLFDDCLNLSNMVRNKKSEECNEKINNISLFPNPFKESISISTLNPVEVLNIKIYNNLGVLIYSANIEQKDFNKALSLKNYPPGYYTFVVTEENTTTQQFKMIKQ